MKKYISLFLSFALVFALASCYGESEGGEEEQKPAEQGQSTSSNDSNQAPAEPASSAADDYVVKVSSGDSDFSWNESEAVKIILEEQNAICESENVVCQNGLVTIKAEGTYVLSGKFTGQIRVEATKDEKIRLVFNGVEIHNPTSSPLYVLSADKVTITLADSTENKLTDGKDYVFEENSDEPNAALFSKEDLVINGNGSLTVKGNYNNGIASKDDLVITGGNISVTASKNGIKGKDGIAVTGGTINITAEKDGLKSDNETDEGRGVVVISGGSIAIFSGDDGIQATARIDITGGNIKIKSGGGSINSSSGTGWDRVTTQTSNDQISAKGIAAAGNIKITGGLIDIDSSNDSVHSNSNIYISNGDLAILSGDDGIHADTEIVIDGGNIKISKSYEGIESSTITINGGNIYITSSDDGLNTAGGSDASQAAPRPGRNNFRSAGNTNININGGYIFIDAAGDGIDSNANIYMKDGKLIINGPVDNGNGAIDYDGEFILSGGELIACGSSGMLQTPSANSTVNVLCFYTDFSEGSVIAIRDGEGKDILSFSPLKQCRSIVYSANSIANGETYSLYTDCLSAGDEVGGVYSKPSSGGNLAGSITVSSVINSSGNNQQGGFGRPFR